MRAAQEHDGSWDVAERLEHARAIVVARARRHVGRLPRCPQGPCFTRARVLGADDTDAGRAFPASARRSSRSPRWCRWRRADGRGSRARSRRRGAGGKRSADERTPERQHVGAQPVEHYVAPADGVHKPTRRSPREPAAAARADFDGPRAARRRERRATELGSPRDGLLRPTHPRKRVEHPVPMLPVMRIVRRRQRQLDGVLASGHGGQRRRRAVAPARGRAGLSSATDAKYRHAARSRRKPAAAAAVVGRGAPRRRAAPRVRWRPAVGRCRRRHRNLQRILRIY